MLKDLGVMDKSPPPPDSGHIWRMFPSLTRLQHIGELTVIFVVISEAFYISVTLLHS